MQTTTAEKIGAMDAAQLTDLLIKEIKATEVSRLEWILSTVGAALYLLTGKAGWKAARSDILEDSGIKDSFPWIGTEITRWYKFASLQAFAATEGLAEAFAKLSDAHIRELAPFVGDNTGDQGKDVLKEGDRAFLKWAIQEGSAPESTAKGLRERMGERAASVDPKTVPEGAKNALKAHLQAAKSKKEKLVEQRESREDRAAKVLASKGVDYDNLADNFVRQDKDGARLLASKILALLAKMDRPAEPPASEPQPQEEVSKAEVVSGQTLIQQAA